MDLRNTVFFYIPVYNVVSVVCLCSVLEWNAMVKVNLSFSFTYITFDCSACDKKIINITDEFQYNMYSFCILRSKRIDNRRLRNIQ